MKMPPILSKFLEALLVFVAIVGKTAPVIGLYSVCMLENVFDHRIMPIDRQRQTLKIIQSMTAASLRLQITLFSQNNSEKKKEIEDKLNKYN